MEFKPSCFKSVFWIAVAKIVLVESAYCLFSLIYTFFVKLIKVIKIIHYITKFFRAIVLTVEVKLFLCFNVLPVLW